MEQDMEQMLEGSARCDFCGSEEPRYVYPAEDYETSSPVDGRQLVSDGGWVACSICKSVVDKNSTEELVAHVITEFMMRRPGLEDRLGDKGMKRVEQEITTLYTGFMEARTADAIPFG